MGKLTETHKKNKDSGLIGSTLVFGKNSLRILHGPIQFTRIKKQIDLAKTARFGHLPGADLNILP